MISRNRTPSLYICYAMYLFFFGLSLENLLTDYHPVLSNEIMFLYGIGFRGTNPKKDITKK